MSYCIAEVTRKNLGNSSMISVLIVDDHAVARQGVRRILEGDNSFNIIGEADCGESAIKLAKENRPQVILMDLKMPDMDGLVTTQRILRYQPDTKILVLTSIDNDIYPPRLLKAGAVGYLTKHTEPSELVKAIKAVASGRRYIDANIANQMAYNSATQKAGSPFDRLSDREMQVVLRIIRGEKPKQVANSHHISSKTVNSYRYRVFEKLGIKNDVQLTLLAIQHGLLEVEEELGKLNRSEEE